MHIRRLTPADAEAFQALRLEGLKEAPSSFGSSFEEEEHTPLSALQERLAHKADRGPFGAFEDGTLVGLVALGRENMKKLAHKAFIWGMYVTPAYRGKGIARALLIEALALARAVPGVRQVNLCLNASNAAALRLYESLGFTSYGCEPGGMQIDGELLDEIHMTLRIA